MQSRIVGRMWTAAACLVAVVLLATACGEAVGEGDDAKRLAGIVSVDGSSTVFPITEAVAEEFSLMHRRVKVTVGISGTGGGFKKFCAGGLDIVDASRTIRESEAAACQEAGVEYVELSVALDGLAIVVHPKDTWIDCITTAELKRIWEPNSSVKRWSDIRPGFPDREIKLFGPATDSGTFDYFTEAINGEEGASRSDFTASEDDNVLVNGIAGTQGGLAYFGYAYFAANEDRLKALKVDDGAGCVEVSEETVRSGTYKPLSRPLFVYVNKQSVEKPEVLEFMRFYLTDAVLTELVAQAEYIPLSEPERRESRQAFEAFGAAS